MSSRRIEDLAVAVREAARAHVLKCADEGIELTISCTLRSEHAQARLYRQGRPLAQIERKMRQLEAMGCPSLAAVLAAVGPQYGTQRMTFAAPGESFHQYRLAYDCVPIVEDKPVWGTGGPAKQVWQRVGALGRSCGLEWAGDFTRRRELPHFQLSGGRSVRELMLERYWAAPENPEPPDPWTPATGTAEEEAAALRSLLAEKDSVVLLLASDAGVHDEEVCARYELAALVAGTRPERRWRALWVHAPADLPDDLRRLLGLDPPVPLTRIAATTGRGRRPCEPLDLDTLACSATAVTAFAEGEARTG